jgi:hypothetical protein
MVSGRWIFESLSLRHSFLSYSIKINSLEIKASEYWPFYVFCATYIDHLELPCSTRFYRKSDTIGIELTPRIFAYAQAPHEWLAITAI